MVGGTLYLIGISPFIACEPTELDTSDVHGALFLARPVDTKTLSTWSQRYDLTDLLLAPGNAPAAQAAGSTSTVVVDNAAGESIAHLSWQPE